MNSSPTLENIIEGLLLASKEPLSIKSLYQAIKNHHDIDKKNLENIIIALQNQWQNKTVNLIQVAHKDGVAWRFQTNPCLNNYISSLVVDDSPHKYSRATMEILAIIAYKQPVTRGDIENIRGVAVNTNSIRMLEERGWIEVIGQREIIGRPNLYGTTPLFLQDLGLLSLGQLPTLQQSDISV